MQLLRTINIILAFINVTIIFAVIAYVCYNGKKGVPRSSFLVTVLMVNLLIIGWICSELLTVFNLSNSGLKHWVNLFSYIPWCFLTIPPVYLLNQLVRPERGQAQV